MEIRNTHNPVRGPYRASYTADDMADAFKMCIEEGLPVERVAKKFNVPINTLKDRVRGKIDVSTVKSGPSPTFSLEQEAILSQHLITMAEIGYGYSRQETINLASDYAIHLGIRDKGHRFSLKWLYAFLGRWPELKLKKPRALEIARAKSATRPIIDRYFQELNTILTKYDLKDKPSRIYNVDEKGLSMQHKPPKILSGKVYKAQAVTSGKSNTVTVIGGGNAIGHQCPPFFIFPGVRMQPSLLDGASPGAAGTVSESGWSNSLIFEQYMKDHLEPLLPARDATNKVLVLYDGHKSHVSLGLIEWAKQNHIILFVLPPHCSHLLQPMDVSCFGPFEIAWNAAIYHHLRSSGGHNITRYDVCKLACRVYTSTLTPGNLQSAFKRCGIYPFNDKAVNDSAIAPSLSFGSADVSNKLNSSVSKDDQARLFLEERGGKVLENVQVAKVRKTLSKVVGGKAITEDSIHNQIVEHINKNRPVSEKPKSQKSKVSKSKTSVQAPVPSTSGRNTEAVHIPASDVDSSSDESDIPESEKCCICKQYTPPQLKYCISLTLVKWGQCDVCDRWVHLSFCSPVKVLRSGDSFECPLCASKEE